LSGEEEAIYSWTAINFLKGDLLSESKGIGPATGGKEGTYGTLDLGGASSQIAFYVKNQGTRIEHANEMICFGCVISVI
jgi:Golgi nucleoside diphosphatase